MCRGAQGVGGSDQGWASYVQEALGVLESTRTLLGAQEEQRARCWAARAPGLWAARAPGLWAARAEGLWAARAEGLWAAQAEGLWEAQAEGLWAAQAEGLWAAQAEGLWAQGTVPSKTPPNPVSLPAISSSFSPLLCYSLHLFFPFSFSVSLLSSPPLDAATGGEELPLE